MTPKEILQKWIDCFNAADAVALANLYAQDAINHQVANTPVIGKTAIHEMFVNVSLFISPNTLSYSTLLKTTNSKRYKF